LDSDEGVGILELADFLDVLSRAAVAKNAIMNTKTDL